MLCSFVIFPLEEKFVSISFQHCILGVNKSVGQQALVSFLVFFVFLSLRASSPGRSGGGAGKGRRVCNYDSTSNSPVARRLSCQISANQRGVETSANVNKHWKTRGYNLITKVISAIQLCFPGNANLIQYHQSPIKEKGLERPRTPHRPFASSKNSHEAMSKTFLVKISFNCMGLKKTYFHVNLASLFLNKYPTCSKSVVAFYLGLCFPSVYSRNKAKLRACLHGVGYPGLVGLVSFVFTLWGTQNKRNMPH